MEGRKTQWQNPFVEVRVSSDDGCKARSLFYQMASWLMNGLMLSVGAKSTVKTHSRVGVFHRFWFFIMSFQLYKTPHRLSLSKRMVGRTI